MPGPSIEHDRFRTATNPRFLKLEPTGLHGGPTIRSVVVLIVLLVASIASIRYCLPRGPVVRRREWRLKQQDVEQLKRDTWELREKLNHVDEVLRRHERDAKTKCRP